MNKTTYTYPHVAIIGNIMTLSGGDNLDAKVILDGSEIEKAFLGSNEIIAEQIDLFFDSGAGREAIHLTVWD